MVPKLPEHRFDFTSSFIQKKSRKFFVVTFLGSILWIAVFSYLMVWWAHQVSDTSD